MIVVGNGLFKANAGNLVRKIYEGDDSKIDSAFTIYYMAVNLGAMISMLPTPWLKDYFNASYGNGLGWHAAFARLRGRPGAGPDQLRDDAREHRPRRLAAGRHADALGQARRWSLLAGVAVVFGVGLHPAAPEPWRACSCTSPAWWCWASSST